MFEKFYLCFVLGLCFTTCAHMINIQDNREIQTAELQSVKVQSAPVQYSRAESIPYENLIVTDGNDKYEGLIAAEGTTE